MGHSGDLPKGREVEYTIYSHRPLRLIILAIDTTTRAGSIAVTRDDDALALVHGDDTRTHGERLPGEIGIALDKARVSKSAIDLISVAAGPGAFTGLRIGLAAAQGLALTLDRPVVGVSALDALAWTVFVDDPPNQPPPGLRRSVEALRAKAEGASPYIAPWMDAQRGDVFAALYTGSPSRLRQGFGVSTEAQRAKVEELPSQPQPWTVIEPGITARPLELLESWNERIAGAPVLFVGDATVRDADLIARAGGGRWLMRSPDALALSIAQIGRRLAVEGRAGPPHRLTPIYVRRPDAEIERDRRRSS